MKILKIFEEKLRYKNYSEKSNRVIKITNFIESKKYRMAIVYEHNLTFGKNFNIIDNMNIKQALKEKNKLAKKITDLMDRVNRYNSVDEGGVRSYDPEITLRVATDYVEELVELKTKIHKANAEVYDIIFRMSEYKSLVKYLRSLNCTEGTVIQRGYGETTTRQMTTVITEVQRDQMVEKYESMIDQLQSELDAHNVTAHID